MKNAVEWILALGLDFSPLIPVGLEVYLQSANPRICTCICRELVCLFPCGDYLRPFPKDLSCCLHRFQVLDQRSLLVGV